MIKLELDSKKGFATEVDGSLKAEKAILEEFVSGIYVLATTIISKEEKVKNLRHVFKLVKDYQKQIIKEEIKEKGE